MKKIFLILFISTSYFLSGCKKYDDGTQLPYVAPEENSNVELEDLVANAAWQTENVADGIVWKYYQFPNIFDSRQSITLFDIDMNKDIKLDIPYVTKGNGFLKTSDAATTANADVAINGSYFDTTNGGSTPYFRSKSSLITQTVTGFTSYRENAAFTISVLGKPGIAKKPGGGWDQINAAYVLAGGPLLVFDGKKVPQLDVTFNTGRNPRTVIGITKDNHLLMLVNDGRSGQSLGLGTVQLSELMLALGCEAAVNMDGGGSSTAWVKGEGVVNYPSDNGKFDHAGERAVATVITATAK